MKLLLKRKYKADTYTIGDLYIGGEFFCNTIEDAVRTLPSLCPYTPKWLVCKCKEKVFSETAIPAGVYKVTMETSPKFGKVLPRLHDVPHFLGILIHSGVNEKSSAGCIIVGFNTVKGQVSKSKEVSDRLNAILGKERNITIEFI